MSLIHLEDLTIGPGDALIVVDVQNDFLPGGRLAVPEGDEVVAPLNRAILKFIAAGQPVFATRDWHPPDHVSFLGRGGLWPPHCIRDTLGAAFAPTLHLPASVTVISKATSSEREAYSGFDGTDLARRLREAGVKHVFVGGLATDYCVLNTVHDALDRDFMVSLLVDAVRAVEVHPGDGERALAEMARLGAVGVRVGPHVPEERLVSHVPP
jgi:nicotinamidase-related amidase